MYWRLPLIYSTHLYWLHYNILMGNVRAWTFVAGNWRCWFHFWHWELPFFSGNSRTEYIDWIWQVYSYCDYIYVCNAIWDEVNSTCSRWCAKRQFITVTLNEQHAVTDHQELDCLFKACPRKQNKTKHNSALMTLCERYAPIAGDCCSQRATKPSYL